MSTVSATAFLDLERWGKSFQATPARGALALDEEAIARTEKFGIAHVARLVKRNITLSR
jgi:hypothetical protein